MTSPATRPRGSLHARELQVGPRDRPVLGPVDLALPAGVMVAVTGASGSGKSALLWSLAGALVPGSGSVELDGRPIGDRGRASRLGIALMPEGSFLVSTLTAAENVTVTLLGQGAPADTVAERTSAALHEVGLLDERNHLPEELSGGQQQRVAVAVLLASRARVLLLDEPTSELDAGNRQRVLGALRRQVHGGATVVIATHDSEAAAAADGELRLDEGALTWTRPLPADELPG